MRLKIRKLYWLSLLAAGEAAALGLGEITVHSSLGERFRAEVQLLEQQGEEAVSSDCFRLVQGENQELPILDKAMLTVERQGGDKRRLLIVSNQSVHEPVMQLNLRVGCGAEITRSYSLFIDPSVVARKPLATRDSRQTAVPVAPSVADRPDRMQWSTGEGESLRSIAAAMYPGMAGAQARFMQAMRASNPELDFGAQGRNVLLVGTQLSVPSFIPSRPANDVAGKPAASSDPVAAPSSSRLTPPPEARVDAPRVAVSPRPGDRLLLSGRLGDSLSDLDDLHLKMATDLGGTTSELSSDAQRAMLRVEYQLLASLNEKINQQLSLTEQIRRLEQSLIALQAAAGEAGSSAEVPQVSLPVAVVDRPQLPVKPPALETKAVAEEQSSLGMLDWLLLLAALLAVGFSTAWFLQRRARLQAEESVAPVGYPEQIAVGTGAFQAKLDLDMSDFDSQLPAPEGGAARDAVAADDLPPGESVAPLSELTQEPELPAEDNSFNPVMELAEVMLSFGRVKGATQALEEYIELNPTQALQPWMKLLEIYRQHDMRDDFEKYSEKLPLQFNVARIDWDSPVLLQQSPVVEAEDEGAALEELFKRLPNVAAMPHIVARITSIWGSQECAEYLTSLLRDNRNGERSGFSLGVVRELLFLNNFVEKHLSTSA